MAWAPSAPVVPSRFIDNMRRLRIRGEHRSTRPDTVAGAMVELGYFGLLERDWPGHPTRNRDLDTFTAWIGGLQNIISAALDFSCVVEICTPMVLPLKLSKAEGPIRPEPGSMSPLHAGATG